MVICLSFPLTYPVMLSTASSNDFFASGLNFIIAGLIIAKNLSSQTFPLYSVMDVFLVYILKGSEPTTMSHSYASISISISTSLFKIFFFELSEHRANLSYSKSKYLSQFTLDIVVSISATLAI